MLPDVEGEQRLEAGGDGVASVGALEDEEGAGAVGGEPYPAGAEEARAFGFEVGFEGVEGAPLLFDLHLKMPGRAGHDGFIVTHDLIGGLELGEVHIVVVHLAGVVEDGGIAGRSRQ